MRNAKLSKVSGKKNLYCLKESYNVLAYYLIKEIPKDPERYSLLGFYRIDWKKTEGSGQRYVYYFPEDEYFYETVLYPLKLSGKTLEERVRYLVETTTRIMMREDVSVEMV